MSSANNNETPDAGQRDASESVPLSALGPADTAVITRIDANLRNSKKFSDIGFVRGQQVKMEQRTLFGGLLRVNVLDTSVALHKEDAKHILVKINPQGGNN